MVETTAATTKGTPFLTLFKTYLKFYSTTKRFYVIFPLYIALSLITVPLLIAGVIPKPTDVYTYTVQNFGNFVFATALIAGLFGGDAVSRDFGREGLFTLTQPIRRSEILIARYLSVFLVSAFVMLIDFFGLGFAFSYYFLGTISPNALEITALGALFVASITAFAILFSSFFKNPMVSIIVTIVVLWIVMPAIQSVLGFAKIEPWFFITYAGSVVQNLGYKTFPPHSQTISTFSGSTSFSITTFNAGALESVAIMVVYLVISLAIAWFVYSRKELREV